MSVSPQDVEKVALLARLAISESDLPEVTERFGRVLGLVDELNTIDDAVASVATKFFDDESVQAAAEETVA